MDVAVLVPWRGGDPYRERLWAFVRPLWEAYGWPVVTGASPDGPFNRSAAVNDAATKVPWDMAVIIDADTYARPVQVRAAIERASETGRIAYAHDQWRGMTPKATNFLLREGPRQRWEHLPYTTLPRATVSSCLAIRRDLWDAVGGFDERFRGWGFEDRAFAIACETFGEGSERISGPVFHLWHPSQRVHRGGTFEANRQLRSRYGLAAGDREAILAIRDEAMALP